MSPDIGLARRATAAPQGDAQVSEPGVLIRERYSAGMRGSADGSRIFSTSLVNSATCATSLAANGSGSRKAPPCSISSHFSTRPVGVRNPDSRSDSPGPGRPRYDRPMWSLLYLVAHTFIRLLVSGGQQGQDGTKDLEILVLRHQLRVLQRTAGPPRLRTIDRVLLAAASRVLPRDRWVAFLVTPGDPPSVTPRARAAEADLP